MPTDASLTTAQIIIIVYFLIMSIVGFISMGVDKSRAKSNQWRVPEKTLFLISILGGSLGSNIGMYAFRHKTKHWYFVIFMPLILIAHAVLIYFILR